MALLTRPVARKAAAAAIFSAAASASRAFATTAVLVNMDSAVAANFKFATGTHHCCSGLPGVIINNVLIATTPDLVAPDAAASVLVVGSASAGSTAMAYTARLTLDHFAGTGSSSVTLLNKTVTAVYDATDLNAALMVHVVYGVIVATPAVTSTFITAVIAAADNAVASGSEFSIAADPFAGAVDVFCYAVAATAAFVAAAAHTDVMPTIATIEAIAANLCPGNRLREG